MHPPLDGILTAIEANIRIETQDVLLRDFGAERLVEIGPSPTLAGMAKKTLQAKYESYDAAKSMQRDILCYSSDIKNIYYNFEDTDEAAVETPARTTEQAPSVPKDVTVQSAPAAQEHVAAVPVQNIPDEPVKAVDIVHALIAQ